MIMVAHDLLRIPRKAVEGRLARVSVKELEKRSGILRRHCAKHQRIYEAEDCSVRADAKGKSQNSNTSEAGRLTQRAETEAQILPARLHERFPAGSPDDFLRNFETSLLQMHGAKRILATHPLLHLFFGRHLQEAV